MDVLVVEDEAPLRESLVDGLSGAFTHLTVAGVQSVEDAEPLLSTEQPALIISDVRLPGKDGVELLLDVRARWPSAPFIFMSAYPSPEAKGEAETRGIQFLRKPFEFAELLDAVENALEHDQFSGEVGGISLVDLLQLLNMGRRTAAVTVERRGESGRIFMADGDVVHAMVGELSGRPAFDRLMAWKGGSFGSEPGCVAPATTIIEPFNSLLLDCFRVQDEGAGNSEADELVDDLFGADDLVEAASAGPEDAMICVDLEQALDRIPGCIASACIDLATGDLLGLAPRDAVAAPVAGLVPTASKALFDHAALRAVDLAFSRSGESDPVADTSRILEIIAVSDGATHFFQRSRVDPTRAFATVCRNAKNLGTLVAKARGWLAASVGRDA